MGICPLVGEHCGNMSSSGKDGIVAACNLVGRHCGNMSSSRWAL